MNFYRRRPLALALSLGMLAVAAAAFLPGMLKLFAAALTLAAVPVTILLLRKFDIWQISGIAALPFVILTEVIILCLMLTSWAYFDLYAAPYDRLMEAPVHGTVVDMKSDYSYSCTYVVRFDTVNGEHVNVKGLLYTDTAIGMARGDTFSVNVTFGPLDEFYSYYNVTSGEMLASGYVFGCETSEYAVITGRNESLEVRLAQLRDHLDARLSLYLDRSSAALSKALLLGDRSELGRLRRDFKYAGVSHLLAVSGLHMQVLVGGFLALLLKLNFPHRLRYILSIFFILFYMALTGFPVSVVRTGIMVILAHIAIIIERKSDQLTNLFLSAALILLVDPPSVHDKAFVLSVSASLGVLLVSADADRLLRELFGPGRKTRRRRKILSSFFVAMGATMFVLPLQWLYFGEVSLLSVPATLLLVPFCEVLLFMLVPLLTLALLGWHFWCGRLGWIVMLFCEFVEMMTGWMAELSPLVSLRYPFVPVIVLAVAAVIVWMIASDRGSWVHALIPFVSGTALFFVCVTIWNARFGGSSTLSYVSKANNEAMVLISAGESMIIDVSTGSRPMMVIAAETMAESRHTEADALLLTHIHRRHVNAVRALLEECVVHRAIAPVPSNVYEEYILLDLLDVLREYGVEVSLYDRAAETALPFGNVTLELPEYTLIGRSTHPLPAVRFVTESSRFTYAGGSVWEDAYLWEFAGESDRLLLGLHGPVYKTPPYALPEGCMVMVPEGHPLMHALPGLYSFPSLTAAQFLLEP